MIPNYKIMTKRTCYSTGYSDEERESLVTEQDNFLREKGYNTWNKDYRIHFFDSHFFNETTETMNIETAIECLAIKDGVDLVQYENGNYGYVAYYNGCENGFEILGEEEDYA